MSDYLNHNSSFVEGDLVSFKNEHYSGEGTICGVNGHLWIIKIKESDIDKSYYPYSCIMLSFYQLKLLKTHKEIFTSLIEDVRDSYKKLADVEYCYGVTCEDLIKEGVHAYTQRAKIKDGKCTQCHRIAIK